MDYAVINGETFAYRVYGHGGKTIIIDAAIGTCCAEWWHIADMLSDEYKVVTFDRLGCGTSKPSVNQRTPQNIAKELNGLLEYLNLNTNLILIGHSQGGFYAMQYALSFPSKVCGLVLLDPATPFDNEFSERLTARQYKKSGVDKTFAMKLGLSLTSLKLGFAAKPMLKKSPPFCYYRFSKEAEDYLLASLCGKSIYQTSLDEYKYTHSENEIAGVKKAIENRALGNTPLCLITHSSDVYYKELRKYGGMDLPTAVIIEDLWQEIMKKVLNASANSKHVTAANSGHFIHLTDFDTVREALRAL